MVQALVLLALGAILAWTYRSTAVDLAAVWKADPNYSHGFLVPAGSAVFAWIAWRRQGPLVRPGVRWGCTGKGLLEIALGLALHAVAILAGSLLLDVLSLICVLRGCLLALGGREANEAFGFAALFLIFASPLPMGIYQPIAVALQEMASRLSSGMLEWIGLAVYREGYRIHLPGFTMEVAEACSGLRQIVAVLAFAVILGHFAGRTSRYRWTLGLAALPVAVLANSVRVVLCGLILRLFGRQWAQGVFHTLEGLGIAALAIALLLAIAAGLSRWEKRHV